MEEASDGLLHSCEELHTPRELPRTESAALRAISSAQDALTECRTRERLYARRNQYVDAENERRKADHAKFRLARLCDEMRTNIKEKEQMEFDNFVNEQEGRIEEQQTEVLKQLKVSAAHLV
ncbi:MAG: hypothetical protein MHM6MM_001623 [Cercozoa sp. M6MM]